VINQSFSDWELILVDDGSSDKSGSICDNYFSQYPEKVQVVHQENRGVLCARRVAMTLAHGEYLCFLDSDDYWDVDLLSELDGYQKQYNADILVFGFRTVDSAGMVIDQKLPCSEILYVDANSKEIIFRKIEDGHLSCLWAEVVRRSIADLEVDYSPYYHVFKGEDLLQNLAFIDQASSFLLIPKAFYSYFVNREGLTHKKITIEYLESHVVVQEKLLNYMQRWGMNTDRTMQMFSNVFFKTIGSLMRDSLLNPLYSRLEKTTIIEYLTSDIRDDYLHQVKVDWNYKRYSVCIKLMKKRRFKLLWFALVVFRIVNSMKAIIRRS